MNNTVEEGGGAKTAPRIILTPAGVTGWVLFLVVMDERGWIWVKDGEEGGETDGTFDGDLQNREGEC